MTEDEAFQDLELRQEARKRAQLIEDSLIAASKFINEYQTEIGIMTLRKAFEIGYRTGYQNGTAPRTK